MTLLALNPYELGWSDGWKTDAIVSVSTWSEQNIVLSSVDSSEPGPFRTARTPYVREILECLSPQHPATRVVFMASAQVAKTRTGLNWLGYIVDCAPGPTLLVQPTVDTAKRVSKQRIGPMLENVEALRRKIKPSRERDSGNTQLEKEFPGGILILGGANSAAGLRSMPVRNLFLDEVDAYPPDVDGEGDPVALAEQRTGTFGNRRKIYISSTPTIKGLSRIEAEYLASDQRRFFLPCPHCGFFDYLRWANLRWPDEAPDLAQLLCEACGAMTEERYKTQMLERGQWRPTAKPARAGVVGFHLNALYAPLGWRSWAQLANEFREAKKEPLKLKTFINAALGETWEEKGDEFDADDLQKRLENYAAEVPNGVGLLVGAVDVQGDRLEWQCKGYGAGEQSWLIAFGQVDGDPANEATWLELDKELIRTFDHESGRKLAMRAIAIDSGGLHTDMVYKFCKVREARRVAGQSQKVWAIKGVGGAGREILGRPSSANRYKCKLWPIGVDTAKDTIFSRLHIMEPGGGFVHLPAWLDREYLEQLTSEKAVKRYKKGVGTVREYVKTRDRNEALDLEVYSLAALYTLGRETVKRLPMYAQDLLAPFTPPADGAEPPAVEAAPIPPPKPTKPRGFMTGYGGKGFINKWKK